MPGGLEGRLLRERIRGERLDNAQKAMSMTGMEGILRDRLGMSELRQGDARTELYNEEAKRMALENRFAGRDRRHAMEQDQLRSIIDAIQAGGMSGNTDVLNEILKRLGVQGQLTPPQSMGMEVDPEQAAIDAQIAEALKQRQQQ